MSSDEFLDGLRGDWQSRMADPAALSASVRQGEAALRSKKVVRLSSLLTYLVLTLVFGYFSWTRQDPLFHLGAVAFLVAFLLTAGEFMFLRRVTGADFMAGKDALIEKAELQAQSAVMLSQAALAAAALLSVCAIIAAIYAVSGYVNPWQAGPLAAVWAVTGFLLWVNQRKQSAKAEAELEQIRSMRAELEGGE